MYYGATINKKDINGLTALHKASALGYLQMVK